MASETQSPGRVEYTYTRNDGTVERAESKEQVFNLCPILGGIALSDPELANMMLDAAAEFADPSEEITPTEEEQTTEDVPVETEVDDVPATKKQDTAVNEVKAEETPREKRVKRDATPSGESDTVSQRETPLTADSKVTVSKNDEREATVSKMVDAPDRLVADSSHGDEPEVVQPDESKMVESVESTIDVTDKQPEVTPKKKEMIEPIIEAVKSVEPRDEALEQIPVEPGEADAQPQQETESLIVEAVETEKESKTDDGIQAEIVIEPVEVSAMEENTEMLVESIDGLDGIVDEAELLDEEVTIEGLETSEAGIDEGENQEHEVVDTKATIALVEEIIANSEQDDSLSPEQTDARTTENIEETESTATIEVFDQTEVVQVLADIIDEEPEHRDLEPADIHEKVDNILKIIDQAESIADSDKAAEVLAQLQQEMTDLLTLLGYENAAEIVERLAQQFDIQTLRTYMIMLLQSAKSPERLPLTMTLTQSVQSDRHQAHIYGIRAVRMVVTLVDMPAFFRTVSTNG